MVSVIRRNISVNFSLKNISKCQWGIVVCLIVAIYFFVNLALPDLFTGFSRTYVVWPILWCLLAVSVIMVSRYGSQGRLVFTKSKLPVGLLMGAFHVAWLVIVGTLVGFGHSPYAHAPYMVLLNLFYIGMLLIGLEFSRAYLLNAFGRRYPVIMMSIIALFFTVVMTPWMRLTSMTNVYEGLPYLGGTMLPLLAQNFMACLLAILGGPVAAIAYLGAIYAFQWFSPILPDMTWTTSAFIGTMVPVISLLLLQSMYNEIESEDDLREAKTKTRKHSSIIGWAVTSIVVVVIIWGSFGLLGFNPIVIISGSMEPAIDVGDIAIVRDVSNDDIDIGDIIVFERDNITNVHRVIEIQHDGSLAFITQGDANDSPDADLVSPDQIKGRVSFTIPKVGWASIKIKEFLS